MGKRLLFLTNFSSKDELSAPITSFSRAAFNAAKDLDIEFHINTNNETNVYQSKNPLCHSHVVEIYRNPFSKEVLTAYKQLTALLRTTHFDVIHCNTPIGGFLGRVCGAKAGVNTIIYQAHGFHFWRGAPLKNWLFYYPVEKWLAHYTDALITINKEDFELAKAKMHLRNGGKIYYVPGVGIDMSLYQHTTTSRDAIRQSVGLGIEDFIIIAVGRLDKNKNNRVLIEAASRLPASVHIVFCGDGDEREHLLRTARTLNCSDRVHFLGNRADMAELYHMSDCFVSSSHREGLSRSLSEAVASGLPCVVSNIRGNTDLIQDGEGGYLCDPNDVDSFASGINRLARDKDLRNKMGVANLKTISGFDKATAEDAMKAVYREIFKAIDTKD